MNSLLEIAKWDSELVLLAETTSDKWARLYKNSKRTYDDNVTQIVETTAIGVHNVNRFNVQGSIVQKTNIHPDAIHEQNKLILLNKKYFEFDTSASSGSTASQSTIVASCPIDEKTNIDNYATLFDHSIDDSKVENYLDSHELPDIVATNKIVDSKTVKCKNPEKSQVKTNKKKKGRTKYRPLEYDEISAKNPEDARRGHLIAAPPGVKAFKPSSMAHPRQMDISKNGNHSLQFRL